MISLLKLYFDALKGFRWESLVLIILSAISGFLEGMALTVLMPLINEHLKSQGTSSFELFHKAYRIHDQRILIFGMITLFCFLGLLSSLIKLIMEARSLKLRVSLERAYNERLVQAILKTKWTTFLSIRVGDISKGINMESRNIATGAMAIISMLGLMITAVIFFAIGYGLSPRMTLITLSFGGLMWIIFRNFSTHYAMDSLNLSSTSSQINHEVNQLVGNLKFMRSTGLGHSVMNKMSASFKKYEEVFLSLNLYNHVMRFAFELVGLVFVSAILALSAWRAPAALGRVVIFLAVFYRLAPRLAAIQEYFSRATNEQGWYVSWRNLYELISQSPDLRANQKDAITPHFSNTIEARGIHFGYKDRTVLTHVNWTIKKGQCLAIVGESGTGKTTMIDLLTGLLQPGEGQLWLDDVPFTKIDLPVWQSHIGLVMQNAPIFHTTVLENIAWGEASPNAEDAEKAAKMAHAWEFISRLPEKLNAIVGDKGALFSAGECQRLALARALYRKPWLLILDEATNALDAESESIILETLQQIKGHMTLFVVAHRLHTVKFADEIIVMHKGEIVERGGYQELINQTNSRFYKLAHFQGLIK